MTDYLYDAGLALSPSKNERTFQLLVTLGQLHIKNLDEIYDSRIWVILQIGKDYFLYAKLHPCSVESIETELEEVRLLINSNINNSVYYLSSSDSISHEPYRVPKAITTNYSSKLTCISSGDTKILEAIETNAIVRSFAPLTAAIPAKNDLPKITPRSNLNLLVRSVLESAKRLFSVADLSRDARNPSWDEYHYFAYEYIRNAQCFNEKEVDVAIRLAQDGFKNATVCNVDTHFRSIDPEAVKSRTFVAPKENKIDSMAATEKAEKSHQAILRDVSEFLLKSGITPFETSSIDLAFKHPLGLILFEIKSANPDNFFRQCKHALTQILQYAYELEKQNSDVRAKFVIVEKTASQIERQYIEDFFNHCGIGVLFYDQASEWPDRIIGFDSLIA